MNTPKVGSRLSDGAGAVRVIVVRAPSVPGLQLVASTDAESVLGKRYTCTECSGEVLVVQGGPAIAECHGAPMAMAAPKTLPASD